ncbi:hypothetical protein P175DRAFT_0501643 [Aspergillus ochraceoroseus IBT 24754]|uniref:Spindle pole body associated protein SnaD n=3 Tax=Aspergillus subgen. Nidulantes TaxID=2720870 RepID=A0A0F8X1Y5_9EURO|nr:uncharacterized protein P175DRAFT_0501643 [Aspergillus ochraceoroseus IBT 24754]KKK13151.1 hypothetical protein AOCH_004512 [Aspergillus ochraceoroseus]KKK23680.1 hypothetical protein ARAM_006273 [Aspergillus rambellii]PTU21013.1 hypothetical protein P175DRAFT_0501643 [Aspergillus ochraceoroseus IBT 24754]
MADTTSHDTVGASTLAVPYFLAPSPSPSEPPPIDSPDRISSPSSSPRAPRSPSRSPPSSRGSSLDRAAQELDARLAQYTVDFSQFPGAQGPDDNELPEEVDEEEADRLSAVGGPEDFTANLERYLLGEDDTMDHEELGNEEEEEGKQPEEELDLELELPNQQGAQQVDSEAHQPAVEDDAELGEDSEFGPPIDMSTPSHLLRRVPGHAKDVTHLENIEEDPDDDDDEPSTIATPSIRKLKSPTSKTPEQKDADLRRQVEQLTQAVHARDEQLEKNRKRVLEAVSAGEQIKHLQGELLKKTSLIEELHSNRSDGSFVSKSSISVSDFSTLQKQITDMQKELQSRNSHSGIDAERLETIAMLRQQLNLTQEQLKKRDATLDETMAKLKEVTAAKEAQLREKNTEIDGLRSQIDAQQLEIDKLETDVSRANREYRVLEDQMVLLETRNRPLEEKNSTLEADLTRAQSQVTAQENALKAMAADLPLEAAGNTYTEILELIKDLGQTDVSRPTKSKDLGDQETEQLHEELVKLRTQSNETASAQKALELQLARAQEQAAESQILIQSIESENTRMAKRAEDLKSSLDQAQRELNLLRTEHTKALETVHHLQAEENQEQEPTRTQQPSPPPTPLTTRKTTQSSLEATHKAQITNLKTSHATAISTLRNAHTDSTRKLRALLSASEKREAVLRAELDSLRATQQEEDDQTRTREELAKERDEIRSLRHDIKRLQSIIAVKDETAAAMDQRIAKSVEKREKEWERRVELLLKERERMGKALLWTWGEKELGEDKENGDDEEARRRRRQAYRYKHVKR